ncbi:hypothetical protein NW767_015496, partial [Fusarium falciforme]
MEIGSSVSQRNSVAYLNGRVFTVNKDQPWASAFIVSETGIFETVGTDQEIQAIASKRGLVQFDLQKKFIMPGIHDAHSHMYSACMQKLNEATISLEPNDDKIAEKLMEGNCMCSFQGVYGDWIIGNQYISFQFPGGVPDRRHLDHLFPDRPVLIRELSAHKLLLNTAGLKRLGIDDSVSNPPGGFFLRRPDGTLSGEVMETAMERVWCGLPMPPLSHIKRALFQAVETFHSYGITSCQEATATTPLLHALLEMENENRLDLDIYAHIMGAPTGLVAESGESLAALANISEGFRSKHIHPNFMKFILDGSPIPPNLTQADLDESGQPSEKNMMVRPDHLEKLLEAFDAKGMTCKLHATGEGSVRVALNAIEKVRRRNPEGPRHEIAHCNAVHN